MTKKKATKKLRVRKPKPQHPLPLVLKAISELYPKDPSAPGMVLSFLPSGQFYASMVRYDAAMGQGKQVLCSFKADTLDACVTGLAEAWLSKTQNARHLQRAIPRYVGAPNGDDFDFDWEAGDPNGDDFDFDWEAGDY